MRAARWRALYPYNDVNRSLFGRTPRRPCLISQKRTTAVYPAPGASRVYPATAAFTSLTAVHPVPRIFFNILNPTSRPRVKRPSSRAYQIKARIPRRHTGARYPGGTWPPCHRAVGVNWQLLVALLPAGNVRLENLSFESKTSTLELGSEPFKKKKKKKTLIWGHILKNVGKKKRGCEKK